MPNPQRYVYRESELAGFESQSPIVTDGVANCAVQLWLTVGYFRFISEFRGNPEVQERQLRPTEQGLLLKPAEFHPLTVLEGDRENLACKNRLYGGSEAIQRPLCEQTPNNTAPEFGDEPLKGAMATAL